MRTLKHVPIFLGLALLVASSCGVTKYLPDGKNLYNGSSTTVKTENDGNDKTLASELNDLVRPKPNKKLLGWRYKLWFYYVAGEPKGKGLRKWVRSTLGEPPVFAEELNLEKNRLILQNRLENRGFFKAVVDADTVLKGRFVNAKFEAVGGPRYKVNELKYPNDSSDFGKAVAATYKKSFINQGDYYNLDAINAEFGRIDGELKNNGFYFFNPTYLLMLVDSTEGTHQVNMQLTLEQNVPKKATQLYRINDIWVYPTYAVEREDELAEAPAVEFKDYHIIDPDNEFKPKVFERNLIFSPGDVYSREDHGLSLSRLVNLGTFKFVKARFEEVDSSANLLDPYYFLTPLPKKQLRAQVTGLTKSNNATGGEFSLTWRHRNFLRSASQLSVSGFFGLEQQVAGNVNVGTTRYGIDANLYIPRIVAPFKLVTNNAFVPKTRINAGFEFFNRTSQYTLLSIRGSYGFVWKENAKIEHQFNPISINYVNPLDIKPDFQARVDTEITLARSIQAQFIFGPNYNFNYNDLAIANNRRHNFYFNANIDAPGNLLGLITGSSFKEKDQRVGSGAIFKTPFSQYARAELEGRHYLRLGTSTTTKIVSRLLVGAGVPFGNSDALPFVKAFFIGGTNSIRAFRARSLGPGTYYVRNEKTSGFLPDQPGDIKLEVNTEFRAKLISILHGALFVDAGNIWTTKEDTNRPGSKFTNKFLNQMAVGAGFGLRVDISFIVVRVDIATPIRKPYLQDGPDFVFDKFDFGSSDWRKENIVLNLAIGYPF